MNVVGKLETPRQGWIIMKAIVCPLHVLDIDVFVELECHPAGYVIDGVVFGGVVHHVLSIEVDGVSECKAMCHVCGQFESRVCNLTFLLAEDDSPIVALAGIKKGDGHYHGCTHKQIYNFHISWSFKT